MDSYIFSILYKRAHFSLPLNLAIHRMGEQHTKYSVSLMSQPYFILYHILNFLD